MYSNETLQKFNRKYNELHAEMRAAIQAGDVVKPTVSGGNKKIGRVLNVSLAPIKTCANCSGCLHFCYDIKACIAYPSCFRARVKNTVLALEHPELYYSGIIKRIAGADKANRRAKVFRWHVSGDIPNMDYFDNMVRIAEMFPGWTFWTYTKNYILVNAWIAEHGRDALPKNLVIMFSEWAGMPMINPYGMPEFRCAMRPEDKPAGAHVCPGNCDICIKMHRGCLAGETTWVDLH